MKIGVNQTWSGVRVMDLTLKERNALEDYIKSETGECEIEYIFNDDTSEITDKFLHPDKEDKKPGESVHTFITINGHSYGSWEEMIEGEKGSGNVRVVSGSKSVTITDGNVIIGDTSSALPDGKQVYILVNGNCGNVRADYGTVRVYGDIQGDAKANCGNITCNVVHGDARANCGNINVGSVEGDAQANFGNINNK